MLFVSNTSTPSALIVELHSIYVFFSLSTSTELIYAKFLTEIIYQVSAGLLETAYNRLKAEKYSILKAGASFDAYRSYIRSITMLENYLK